MDYFSERLLEAQGRKRSVAMLGVDPQMDAPGSPGLPEGFTLARFCCEVVEACADSICAIKPQLAFFEARGMDGMRALAEVIALARRLGLLTVADAKRGDIGSTSAAYAEAFLGDGDFGCDAVTVNPYLGSDAIAPFVTRVGEGRGLFVLVKTSNPSSGEFQDRIADGAPVWEWVARTGRRVGRRLRWAKRSQPGGRGGRCDLSAACGPRARADAACDGSGPRLRRAGRERGRRGARGARRRHRRGGQREPDPDVRVSEASRPDAARRRRPWRPQAMRTELNAALNSRGVS